MMGGGMPLRVSSLSVCLSVFVRFVLCVHARVNMSANAAAPRVGSQQQRLGPSAAPSASNRASTALPC